MKLSIFTTETNALLRGDNIDDALECYTELADETVIVSGSYPKLPNGGLSKDGDKEHPEFLIYHWPKEFSWEFIGEQFTRGYEACSGDVVIHADLDFIFHEDDFSQIRASAETMLNNNLPAMSMHKSQFVLPDRYNVKSRIVTMVNKRDYGNRIKFDSGDDLTQPSLDGRYIKPDSVPQSKVGIYNYEKMTKTKDQIAKDQGRMERAWFRHFGIYQMGSDGTDKGALDRWLKAQDGKLNKPHEKIPLERHPKFVQETIKNLTPDQWGHSGFGYVEGGVYV